MLYFNNWLAKYKIIRQKFYGPVCTSVWVCAVCVSSQPTTLEYHKGDQDADNRSADHECFAPWRGASFIQRAVLVLTLSLAHSCRASAARLMTVDSWVLPLAHPKARGSSRAICIRAHVEYDEEHPRSRTQWERGNAILMRGRPPAVVACCCCRACIIFRTSDRKKATWPTRVTGKKPSADFFKDAHCVFVKLGWFYRGERSDFCKENLIQKS